MEWQPIETAPKDRTPVLLWLGKPWDKVEKRYWFEPWEIWLDTDCDPVEAGDEHFGTGSLVPTHWMPLPEPPK